jgi:hypothetical protein
MNTPVLIVIAVLLTLLGCTPTRFHPALVNLYSNTATLSAGSDATVQASCPRGQPLMGGAFKVIANHPESTLVLASFPSGASWTVIAHRYDAGTTTSAVVAVVYCYARQPTAPIQTTIVRQDMSLAAMQWTVSATCPRAAALTGGGYQSELRLPDDLTMNGGVLGSYPAAVTGEDNQLQWNVAVADYLTEKRQYQAYAICATSGLTQAVPIQSSVFSAPNISPLQQGDFMTQCGATQFTTGIGFLLGNGMPTVARSVLGVDVQGDFQSGELIFNPQIVQPPPQVYASCLAVP